MTQICNDSGVNFAVENRFGHAWVSSSGQNGHRVVQVSGIADKVIVSQIADAFIVGA